MIETAALIIVLIVFVAPCFVRREKRYMMKTEMFRSKAYLDMVKKTATRSNKIVVTRQRHHLGPCQAMFG